MSADSPSDPADAFNPYATPTAEFISVTGAPGEFALFLRWEKLRVLYNLILLAVVVLVLVAMRPKLASENLAFTLIFGCLGANVCFCVGPVVNAYAHWFGLRHVAVTAVIFILGSLLSVPLTAVVLLSHGALDF